MDWTTYRKLCDQPQRFTRWMLEQTLELLGDEAMSADLHAALERLPLPRPPGFKAGPETDVLTLRLDAVSSGRIAAAVQDAVVAGMTTSGTQRRGLGGFREAWTEYDEQIRTQMQTAGETLMDAQARVMAMIEGFNQIDVDAIMSCFAADAVYHNMPMDPVQGHEAIRGVIEGFLGAASEVEWVILNASAEGGTVLNERLDRFLVNGTWVELPVMGTFVVENGLITTWRDYFDMNQFQTQFQAAMS